MVENFQSTDGFLNSISVLLRHLRGLDKAKHGRLSVTLAKHQEEYVGFVTALFEHDRVFFMLLYFRAVIDSSCDQTLHRGLHWLVQ